MSRILEALDIVRRAKALGNYDSNVIGMAAEIIAEDELNMVKSATGSKDIDGYWRGQDGIESVQVKGWSCSRITRYKANTFFRVSTTNGPQNLVVILFYCHLGEYEILYSGKTNEVGKIETNGVSRYVWLGCLKSAVEVGNILQKISSSQRT